MSDPKVYEVTVRLRMPPVSDPLLHTNAPKLRISADEAKAWNTKINSLPHPLDRLTLVATDGIQSISFLRQDILCITVDEVKDALTNSCTDKPTPTDFVFPPRSYPEHLRLLRALERRDDVKTKDVFATLPRNNRTTLSYRQIDLAAMNPAILEEGQDLLRILGPYLPALQRASEEVYEGFIKHFNNKEWEEIDRLLYEQMTTDERAALLDAVNQDVRDAALARFNRNEMTKELAWKILTNLLLKVLL